MGWLLWATAIVLWAGHTYLHRWKRRHAMRTANLRKAILKEADREPISVTSSRMSGRVKGSGTSLTATATYQPSSSAPQPGATPPHIPEQRNRFNLTQSVLTWDGWLTRPIQVAPEAGPPAGGEEPSHE